MYVSYGNFIYFFATSLLSSTMWLEIAEHDCAIFQLLIKSMSKIHNTLSSTPLSNFVTPTSVVLQLQAGNKPESLGVEDERFGLAKQPIQGYGNYAEGCENQRYFGQGYNLRFSRFSAWHLTHMAENKQIQRVPGQSHIILDIDIQQESCLEQEQLNCNPVTPGTTYKSMQCPEKEFYAFSSPQQNGKMCKKQKIIKPKQTGLRKLSGKAYKIVKQLGEATYKQVAARLIEEIVNDESSFDDEKQENNIKRRVYDALNVLIAMEILKKSGKNISYGNDPRNRNKDLKRQRLVQNIQQTQRQIQIKNRRKARLQKQIKALDYLAQRNKILSETKNSIQLPILCLEIKSVGDFKLNADGFKLFVKNSEGCKVSEGLESLANLFSQKIK